VSSIKKGLRRAGVGGLSAILATTAMTGFASMASATSTFAFDRVAGTDRFGTSVATAKVFGDSANLILASGAQGHFPDALAASYLAGRKNAPVMLTTLATTPANVAAQIAARGTKNIWIVGGTGVVSAAQEATLATKYTVHRLGGSDRYVTAGLVIADGGAATTTTAVLATGQDFPDALGGGALSYAKTMPMAITKTDTLPAETLAALKVAGTTHVVILGGTAVVSANVVTMLTAAGITSERIFGADRAETSSKLADYELTKGFSNTAVNAASGYRAGDGVDALGGAALSGKELRPLLITDNQTLVGPGVDAFLKAHAATLTTGHIFGGTGALSAAAEAQMTADARGVSSQTFTVTAASGSTFTYADPATAAAVVDTFSATDVFMVDGVTATEAVFIANLSPGDLVTILANTPTTGVTTYQLVNKLAADFTSGLVGPVDTSSKTFSIIEPVTGTSLSGSIDYSTGNTVWTLNGAASTIAAITSNINEGDTVVITGTGADATHLRTIALTNTTVTGTASGIAHSATVPSFFVDTAAGASLGDNPAVGADVAGYVVSSADTFTVDGVTATVSAFDTALSNGDTVTYSRAAGVQTVALTNKAPLSIHGQITAVTVAGGLVTGFTYVPDGGVSTPVTGLPAGIVLTVDGVLSTGTEFATAFTLGDTVVYQAADATTSTTASLKLTDANFSGTVDGASTVTGSTLVAVFAAGSDTVSLGTVNYVTKAGTDLTGTVVYKVNGVVKTLAQFNTSLDGIVGGSLTGTIVASQTGTTATFALTTAIA